MNRYRLVLLALLLTSASLLAGPVRAACELRVGWDDWPSYITRESGRFQGLEYELLTSVADAVGCKLDLIQVPWARALRMLRAGDLDLLYGAGYSAERAEYAKFSVPYRHEQFVLVTKGDAGDESVSVSLIDWLQSRSFENTTRMLGVFRGNFYGTQIEHILKVNQKSVLLFDVSQNDQMVGMLLRDRLDWYIIEKPIAQEQSWQNLNNIRWHLIKGQTRDPIHYMFSSNISSDIIERFNTTIRRRQLTER